MFNPWPSAGLLLVVLVFWYERRLLGGSATLPFAGFRLAFVTSCVSAPLCALLLQRVALAFMSPQTMSWSVGPAIEELVKALPVLILIFAFRAGRYLTVADLTLLGLSSGLGFSFVEQNLRVLASNWQRIGPLKLPSLFESGFDPRNWGWGYSFSGHATAAGMVALVAALAVRFSKRSVYASIPVALALAIVSFDHGMGNWKIEHTNSFFGQIESVDQAPPVIERIYLCTLHGLLETILLPLGLLLGSWAEGVRSRKAIGERPDMLLPGETRPLVPSEWLIALSRLRLGRVPFFQTLAYFRRRRAYALLRTESERAPELIAPARSMEERLLEDCPRIVNPPPSDWIPPRNQWLGILTGWLTRFRWVLIARVLVILVFMLGPWLPEGVASVIYAKYFPLALSALGFLVMWPSLRSFLKQPKPDPARATGEALTRRYFGGLLLGSSVISTLLGVLNVFLRGNLIGGHVIANITDSVGNWGGNPGTLAGLAPLLAAKPDSKPPCADLLAEVQKGEKRIQELQQARTNLEWQEILNAPEPNPHSGPYAPIEDGQTSPLPPSFDDKHLDQAAAAWARRHGLVPAGPSGLGAASVRVPASNGRRPVRDPLGELDQQLAAEKTAQAARVAALAGCQKRTRPAGPPPMTKARINDLAGQIDQTKRQFEELERQLQDAARKDMQAMQDFLEKYDVLMKEGARAAEDYLRDWKNLLPDYKKILDMLKARVDYSKVWDALDLGAQLLGLDVFNVATEAGSAFKNIAEGVGDALKGSETAASLGNAEEAASLAARGKQAESLGIDAEHGIAAGKVASEGEKAEGVATTGGDVIKTGGAEAEEAGAATEATSSTGKERPPESLPAEGSLSKTAVETPVGTGEAPTKAGVEKPVEESHTSGGDGESSAKGVEEQPQVEPQKPVESEPVKAGEQPAPQPQVQGGPEQAPAPVPAGEENAPNSGGQHPPDRAEGVPEETNTPARSEVERPTPEPPAQQTAGEEHSPSAAEEGRPATHGGEDPASPTEVEKAPAQEQAPPQAQGEGHATNEVQQHASEATEKTGPREEQPAPATEHEQTAPEAGGGAASSASTAGSEHASAHAATGAGEEASAAQSTAQAGADPGAAGTASEGTEPGGGAASPASTAGSEQAGAHAATGASEEASAVQPTAQAGAERGAAGTASEGGDSGGGAASRAGGEEPAWNGELNQGPEQAPASPESSPLGGQVIRTEEGEIVGIYNRSGDPYPMNPPNPLMEAQVKLEGVGRQLFEASEMSITDEQKAVLAEQLYEQYQQGLKLVRNNLTNPEFRVELLAEDRVNLQEIGNDPAKELSRDDFYQTLGLNPPEGALPTSERVTPSKWDYIQENATQATSPAETLKGDTLQQNMELTIAEANAEKKLRDILQPLVENLKKDQCTYATEATVKTLDTGVVHSVDSAAPAAGRSPATMETLFAGKYETLGDNSAAAMKQITDYLKSQGPGSQVLIKVAGPTAGHSFSAVNIDGFVKFVDITYSGSIVPTDVLEAYPYVNWGMMKI